MSDYTRVISDLLYFGDLYGLFLDDDHDLVDLFGSDDELWLQLGEFLLHDGHLRGGRLQLLQPYLVAPLRLHHLPANTARVT